MLKIDDGLLLVGHGTRHRAGQDEFLELAALVAARLPEVAVEPCFLELCSPDIPAAIERLMRRGVRRLTVVPLMLFAAGHVREDVPAVVAEVLRADAQVDWRMADHLGCHTNVVALSRRRAASSIVRTEERPTTLLVGRGSNDPTARDEMLRFAELRVESGERPALVGFYAMSAPSLVEALEMATNRPERQVVVQPHLLFQGELLAKIGETVEAWADGPGKNKKWTIAGHLGPDDLLAEAIAQRYLGCEWDK